jgi:NTP pyrophosphatase (non-canonical NTP hydrolase)
LWVEETFYLSHFADKRARIFGMTIKEFQKFIYDKYYPTDAKRGTPGTFMWFMEEVGELASALAGDDELNRQEEFADVLAWLCTLANINNVDLEKAIEKYTVRGVDGVKK